MYTYYSNKSLTKYPSISMLDALFVQTKAESRLPQKKKRHEISNIQPPKYNTFKNPSVLIGFDLKKENK